MSEIPIPQECTYCTKKGQKVLSCRTIDSVPPEHIDNIPCAKIKYFKVKKPYTEPDSSNPPNLVGLHQGSFALRHRKLSTKGCE